ncbi:MAG: hypothetical protein LBV16_03025 [Elusimicrobiota bacterium]|nr:hypothetical protein [Elusimicrobiota bacterium]
MIEFFQFIAGMTRNLRLCFFAVIPECLYRESIFSKKSLSLNRSAVKLGFPIETFGNDGVGYMLGNDGIVETIGDDKKSEVDCRVSPQLADRGKI